MCLMFARNSCPEVFCKKVFLKMSQTLTGKLLCQSLFFNNFAGLRLATLVKKTLLIFLKLFRTPLSAEQLWWLFVLVWLMEKISHSLRGTGHQVYVLENFSISLLYSRQCSLLAYRLPCYLYVTVPVLF